MSEKKKEKAIFLTHFMFELLKSSFYSVCHHKWIFFSEESERTIKEEMEMRLGCGDKVEMGEKL
jgi:hypothetical protein